MRDYCPSRQEQKKLKAKKIKAKKTRRSKKKNRPTSSNWQKLFLVLFSLLLVILLLVFLIYLLRTQQLKQHQLTHTQHLLVVETGRPYSWVVLAPREQKVKVFSFNQLSRQKWSREALNLELPDTEETLFFSLLFDAFIDQVVEYGNEDLAEDKQDQFEEFLIKELRGRGAKNLAFYLEQGQVNWEWFDEDKFSDIKTERLRLQKFLDRNTSANYGKLFECPVAVINSSGEPGLASTFTKLLEKDGFSVVRRDSGPELLVESSLLVDPETEACQQLISRFQQLMPEKNIDYNRELAQEYRASAVIFLAEDLSKLRIGALDFFHTDSQ
jgi:hypothetical protein